MKPFHTALRLLTFRTSAEEFRALDYRDLIFGLLCTWLVGMGRWWEDTNANLLQHLGLGSVAYVFILAIFLWLVLWPLMPPHWSLMNVLVFVSLTAPPALLYAIPVRHGLDLQTAQTVRLWLLAVVAGWRVALLFFYLRRGAGLRSVSWLAAALLPLLLIVIVLTGLNLERVVFDFMGGIRDSDRSVNDSAYEVLISITILSLLAILPILSGYLVCSVNASIAKYGRRTGIRLYSLAAALMLLGGAMVVYQWRPWTHLGSVFIAAGGLVALATALNLRERSGF